MWLGFSLGWPNGTEIRVDLGEALLLAIKDGFGREGPWIHDFSMIFPWFRFVFQWFRGCRSHVWAG